MALTPASNPNQPARPMPSFEDFADMAEQPVHPISRWAVRLAIAGLVIPPLMPVGVGLGIASEFMTGPNRVFQRGLGRTVWVLGGMVLTAQVIVVMSFVVPAIEQGNRVVGAIDKISRELRWVTARSGAATIADRLEIHLDENPIEGFGALGIDTPVEMRITDRLPGSGVPLAAVLSLSTEEEPTQYFRVSDFVVEFRTNVTYRVRVRSSSPEGPDGTLVWVSERRVYIESDDGDQVPLADFSDEDAAERFFFGLD